jgi:hypothetical protein
MISRSVHIVLCIILSHFTYQAVGASNSIFIESSSPYLQYATEAIVTLQNEYYSEEVGLWQGESTGQWIVGWWNSANSLEMLIDFLSVSNTTEKSNYCNVIPNTFVNAPISDFAPHFLNSYNDDCMWWAIAWAKAYLFCSQNKQCCNSDPGNNLILEIM